MKYKDILERLSILTPEQLEQPAGVFVADEEEGHEIAGIDISIEDNYADPDGGVIGNLAAVKETYDDEWEAILKDLVVIPKGTVVFLTEIPD